MAQNRVTQRHIYMDAQTLSHADTKFSVRFIGAGPSTERVTMSAAGTAHSIFREKGRPFCRIMHPFPTQTCPWVCFRTVHIVVGEATACVTAYS